jgi:hypothetical protein
MSKSLRAALPLLLVLTACGSESESAGSGTISVRAYGESFIEDGIPAEDMNDGWAISVARFEVTLDDIVVAGVALSDLDPIDAAASSDGSGHELGNISVAAGAHGQPSFTIARVEVSGSAEQGDRRKTFDWVFDDATRYERCETSTLVRRGENAIFQITVHADHLFFDSLVADEPQLLFEPLAGADTDDDGKITRAELSVAGIGGYDPGNEDLSDLWAWLIAQSRTLGHVDGEGHCEASAAD